MRPQRVMVFIDKAKEGQITPVLDVEVEEVGCGQNHMVCSTAELQHMIVDLFNTSVKHSIYKVLIWFIEVVSYVVIQTLLLSKRFYALKYLTRVLPTLP